MSAPVADDSAPSLGASVRKAVLWRSGSQILAQTITWACTLAVIRILAPADYGVFAMTQAILAFLSFLNGYGFASSLIKDKALDDRKVSQGLGLLLCVNALLALVQVGLAPLAALYYRQPIVADLLRVQALIYLSTPFIALPEALLVRNLDFRTPALANLISSMVMASVALGCALAGLGVWTLIWAPLSGFWSRALALVVLSRFRVRPSFRFAGAGGMVQFGLLLLGSHFFWTVLTQADVFIGGRMLAPSELGLYAEALFLTNIVAAKFVPPLNEVAFPAYARLQDDRAALAAAFLKAVRLIMLATTPLYFGLAATAGPAVALLFGPKWLAMAPLVRVLAFAMPAYTLHILFAPALNAVGAPQVNVRASLCGAAIMPFAYFAGCHWGAMGLAWAWVLAFPLVPGIAILMARRHLGISGGQLARALAPALAASSAMLLALQLLQPALAGLPVWLDLAVQVALGGAIYAGCLRTFSRESLHEVLALVTRRRLVDPLPA